jgi:hypothetical protein
VTSQFIASAAAVALLGAGFAGTTGTRSSETLPAFSSSVANDDGGSGKKCRVDVIRSGTPGAADIARTVETDGTCICTVTTGPAAGNGSAENVVTGLLRDRSCEGAPGVGGPVSSAAAAGGGANVILPILITTVGAAGLAVAIGNDSKG